MKEVSVVGPGCITVTCTAITGTLVYTCFVAYGAVEPLLSEFRFVGNYTTSWHEVESGQRPWARVMATNPAGMSEYSAAMGLPVV